jgi:hypothetical protein
VAPDDGRCEAETCRACNKYGVSIPREFVLRKVVIYMSIFFTQQDA